MDAFHIRGTNCGRRQLALALAAVAVVLAGTRLTAQTDRTDSMTRVAVTFSEGHETEPEDHGRPVVLVAGALGVKSEVFREAFRKVRPARAGTRPSPGQVRANKAALMAALSRYGVTNERLDEVSNYYRYVRSRGELWPTKAAVAYALVQDGKISRFVITDGGSGYSSPPVVTVPGIEGAEVKVKLSFGKDFKKNGSVTSITLSSAEKP